MSDDRVSVTISEIPPKLMDEPGTYSVTLVGMNPGPNGSETIHCGTGTLVKSREQYFILTANHCAKELFRCKDVGLPIRLGGNPLFIRKDIPIYIGERKSEEWGPDLAFWSLLADDVAAIHANSIKTFYNLDRHEEEMLSGDPMTERHLWAVVGSPISESNINGPTTFEFKRNTYTGTIESSTTREGFDYHETRASLVGKNANDTFMKGVSGGGLWFAKLAKLQDGSFALTEQPRLEGVAFYRTAQEDDYVRIRCHGRRSIYDRGLTDLRAELVRRSA